MSKSLQDIIYDSIRDDITKGKYEVEQILPSENMLSKIFNTTRMTVRTALMRLTDEGYIYSLVGKGYFVKEKKYNKYLFEFDETQILDLNIDEVKLMSVEIIRPDVDISYNLKLPSKSRVVSIKRLLFFKGLPVAFDEKYIPYFSGIPIIESEINYTSLQDIISYRESLFTIKKKLFISVVDTEKEIMNMFDFDKPTSVFRIEQTIFDDESEPIGWSKITYLMDYFKINADLILNK